VNDEQWLTDVLAGGDPNARTPSGDTAAHLLVRTASAADPIRAALTALLARGADLSALNHTGQTPLDTATRDDVRALLVSLGGKSARQAIKPTPSHRGK
jgi:ankyrin repeat protein